MSSSSAPCLLAYWLETRSQSSNPLLASTSVKTIWFYLLLLLQKPYCFLLNLHSVSPVLPSPLSICFYWTNLLSLLSSMSNLCNLKCKFDHDIPLLKVPQRLPIAFRKAFKFLIMAREEPPQPWPLAIMTIPHELLVWSHETICSSLTTSCYYMTLTFCLEYPFSANLANF